MFKLIDASQVTSYERRGKDTKEIKTDFHRINFLADLIVNQGRSSFSGEFINWTDVFNGKSNMKIADNALITSTALMKLYPQVVEVILRSEIEYQTWIVERLFDKINAPNPGDTIKIGAIGALTAYEVAESGEYKPMLPDIDGGDMISVQVKKYGGKIGFSLEGRENDKWGLLNLWFQKAAKALVRLREKNGLRLLQEMGWTYFDNNNPAATPGGVTTGRGIDGNLNGTITLNDLFKMYGDMWFKGYTPNTLLIHPFAWMMFATDPQMREILNTGATGYPQGGMFQQLPQGKGGNRFEDPFGKLGTTFKGTGVGPLSTELATLGRLGAHPYATGLNPFGSTFQIAPKGLLSPLEVIVTPFVYAKRLTNGKYLADFILVDSSAVGVHIVKEEPTSQNWEDIEREQYFTKIRERYGFAIYDQGKGVRIARNIVCDRNYVFDNVNVVSLDPLHTYPQWAGGFGFTR